MSGNGEFDDLLAAFNIPITDGQNTKPSRQTSTAADLGSPKKLALNGNASTHDKADIESEDDEGWIIDEGAPSPGNKSQNQGDHSGNDENLSNKLPKARRKQVFPKLSTSDQNFISVSSTPMQGWRVMGVPTDTSGQKENLTNPFVQSNVSKHLNSTLTTTPTPVDAVAGHTLVSNSYPVVSKIPVTTGTSLSSSTALGPPTLPDKVMMPVIDPTSVVSKAVSRQSTTLKPLSTNKPAIYAKVKPKPDLEAIGPPLLSKLINVRSYLRQPYKPSVPLSSYQEYDAPNKGYSCKACGCCFLSDASLQAHLKRHSLTIRHHCDQCCSQYLFYNKCSLWVHFMSHSENASKNVDTLARCITAKPITMEEFLSNNVEPKHPSHHHNCDATQGGRGQMQRLKCPVCPRKVILTHHLEQLDPTNMSECQRCKRLLKNSCERQLHQVVHDSGRLCPGCGLEHLNLNQYYQHANLSDCLYWLSFPLLACWICFSPFYRFNLFLEHLCNQHSLSYYKCSRCQLAFRNFSALSLHLTKEHPAAIKQPPKPSEQKILKCPLCKNVFSSSEAILTHVKGTHSSYIFERIKSIVYRCSLCPKARHFTDRQGLQLHMQIAHKGGKPPVMCDLCGKVVTSAEDLKTHRPVCWKESQQVATKGVNSDQKKPLSSVSPSTKRVLQCASCPVSRRVFYSSLDGYKSHCRIAHNGNTPLPIEIDLITTGTVGPSKATSKMPVQRPVNPTVKESDSTEPSKRPFADVDPCADLKSLKKTKVTPAPVLSCVKCGFSSNDREKFLTHIKTHKENSSYEQCHECGLCFRSQVAVSRHMAMKHLIQTPVAPVVMPLSSPVVLSPSKPKFPKEETSPPKVTQTPKSKPEAARMECTVCYRLFTTDMLLRNHMRTHGMAFIRSKRSSTSKVESN